ncbi:unnamed protein product, partial [Didymodactylos carnosus]
FSQGAALALYTELTFEYKLGCSFVLSGFLPSDITTFNNTIKNSVNLRTSIFISYGGREDKKYSDEIGSVIEEVLKFNSIPHVYKKYDDLAHVMSFAELIDVANFLKKCIPQ